ncbi:unnamed protein product [Candidula unifasciata]|uniref:C2H2-type domain-containing protein n=1 Tax=Candidula unifasciata TaxID=100452 RepID=A0A8S3YWE1_9EUPU|nr:unnamed protein product [Candidula unifasciata]
MANRGYLSGPHRLLPSYTSIAGPRTGVGAVSNSRSSPPDFTYDAFPRSTSGGGGARESTNYTRGPPSPASSALNISYPNVNKFPYGLSGVQMPTYNFGSELYNYVSNGFPRKSRMCTFCNKVFTRSTTRRYHERRCPLLRASNSLAKSEENSAAAAAAAAALKEQQQRYKETASAISSQSQSSMVHSTSTSNTSSSSQAAANLSSALPSISSPPHSLHPAYPSHYSPASALGSSPSRSAAAAYSYAHTYGSHFYNTLSAAALSSLDQNSNSLQVKKESDSTSWLSSASSPNSKPREHNGTHSSLLGTVSLASKSFLANSGVDLSPRQSADFHIRSQIPVFPASSLRDMTRSPSPEPGETRSSSPSVVNRRDSASPHVLSAKDEEWKQASHEKADYRNKIAVANISGARLKTTSPPPIVWNKKARLERAQEQYMKIQSMDEEEDEEEEDEEDEDEVEEDEEQFNENGSSYIEGNDGQKKSEENISGSISENSSYDHLTCQFCKKSFSDIITRQAHEALHNQTKSFGCCLCSHAFHCAYSLRIHLIRHHNEGPYTCKQCSNTFEEITDLKSHLLADHTITKQEACSLKYFVLLDNSERNIAQSGAVSDSEQDTKDKSTLSQRRSADSLPSELKEAEPESKSHENNDLVEPFINGAGLSNEETEVCKICNKAFAKSFIRFHERAHADQKPYECPICNKRFGYKNNMKSHMKLHQGLKPYQCQICGARFTRGSTLRRHGRRHKVSRNNMLDYALFDQNTTPMRSSGNGMNITSTSASIPTASHTTHVTAALTNTTEGQAGSRYHKTATADHQLNKSFGYTSHARSSIQPTMSSVDIDRYNSVGRVTSPRTSPVSASSPRVSSSFLPSQTMTSPLVGGLAAVAAANIFAYPGAATPHLYQFYASSNHLMPYSAYSSNHGVPHAVQSDALNLSLGKRKSVLEEDERVQKIRAQRKDSDSYSRNSPPVDNIQKNGGSVKVEAEEPGEMIKECNPFAQNFLSKTEKYQGINKLQDKTEVKYESKEALKISTEDFAAQVNMCCPSPLVQSSTSSLHHQSSAGSPVGSSSCTDSNIQAHASPSGISHHSSPANSAPSPTNISENHLQELLLSLLASGKMFRCSFCEIYFTEYAMFRLHQKYHQSDVSRPFLCSVCGEDCKDKTYFTVHLSEHLGLSTKSGLA